MMFSGYQIQLLKIQIEGVHVADILQNLIVIFCFFRVFFGQISKKFEIFWKKIFFFKFRKFSKITNFNFIEYSSSIVAFSFANWPKTSKKSMPFCVYERSAFEGS